MRLSDEQSRMLAGERGPALRTAMRMLVAVGRGYGAEDMVPAQSAHVGMSITSLGEAGVEMLEACAGEGLRFAIPTTTNVLSVERTSPGNDTQAGLQLRALAAVSAMGAIANCSCNPFTQGHVPRFDDSVAWSESATAPYINAILGARTNREGATALASALTGWTPRYGMHLDQTRRPTELFEIDAAINGLHNFHVLAAAVCRRSRGGVPALIGIRSASQEELFGFCAAFATYSSGAMFHLIGLTPEARDLAAAFPDGTPPPVRISGADLEKERQRLQGCAPRDATLTVIGCPHASLNQLREVAQWLDGRALLPGRQVFVHTNADVLAAARSEGVLQTLTQAGVEVSADTCVYVGLRRHAPGTKLATDSAKMAFLMASRGLVTTVAATRDCIEAAVGT